MNTNHVPFWLRLLPAGFTLVFLIWTAIKFFHNPDQGRNPAPMQSVLMMVGFMALLAANADLINWWVRARLPFSMYPRTKLEWQWLKDYAETTIRQRVSEFLALCKTEEELKERWQGWVDEIDTITKGTKVLNPQELKMKRELVEEYEAQQRGAARAAKIIRRQLKKVRRKVRRHRKQLDMTYNVFNWEGIFRYEGGMTAYIKAARKNLLPSA